MKQVAITLAAAALFSAGFGSFALAESGSVRILHSEPQAAMVTKEAGVLVFRGLPPTRRVIVNPGGTTPLELKQTEVNETNVFVTPQGEYANALGAKILRLK